MKVKLWRNEERKVLLGQGKFELRNFRTPVSVMTNTPDKHQHEADKNGVFNLDAKDIQIAVAHGLEVEPMEKGEKIPEAPKGKKPEAE